MNARFTAREYREAVEIHEAVHSESPFPAVRAANIRVLPDAVTANMTVWDDPAGSARKTEKRYDRTQIERAILSRRTAQEAA